MSKAANNAPRGRKPRSLRKSRHIFITKSGQLIKRNRGFLQKLRLMKDDQLRKRAVRMAGMPQSRLKRFFYRLHPKRLYRYWFSREGFIMVLKITGIGFAVSFVLLVGLFAYFRKDLPNIKDVNGNDLGGSISYYDRTGKVLLWEDYDAVKRIPVENKDISQFIKDATVAVEDKDFFKHGGFDVRSILRAGINNVLGKGNTQGGSTITQQLVKLTEDWSKDRTVTRKIKELILAVELERTNSKEDILKGYLNTAPYGSIDYGVEAAARDYFDKAAKDLTLDEAVMLAAIPQSPTYYSPLVPDYNKTALLGRIKYIYDLMESQGKITKAQHEDVLKIDTLAKIKPRKTKYADIKAPYFVLSAKEQLENQKTADTIKRGGWKVTTTLDLDLQAIAEDQVSKGLTQVKRQGGDVAALVAEDVQTGQVVALVGGPDFTNPTYGQNNYARYRLPPGSSFKPYDYVSLIENNTNFGAGSVLYDTVGPLEGYACTNKAKGGNCLQDYDFRQPGPITVRYALGGSRNIPAVKAMLTTGVDKTIETADKLGLTSGYKCYKDEVLTIENQCYASSAIGDGAYLKLDEHVHAYATISRNGSKVDHTYILKIEDAKGKTIDQWKQQAGDQVVRPDSAYIVADMLSDPNASYFSAGSKPHRYKGWKFSMKTGTTNDAKDGLMMGFSTKYAVGVWVGYHNRQKVMSGFMETMTKPIWQGFMDKAHDNLTPVDRQKPAGVQTLPAFVVKNHVGIGSVEPSPSTDLFPSWYKQPNKTANGQKQIIDQVSNKLATECTPERAKKEVNLSDASLYSGDRFVDQNTATDQKDDVHHCDDILPTIRLVSLSCDSYCSASVDVTAGTYGISDSARTAFPGAINVLSGGQIVQSYPADISKTYNLTFDYYPPGTKLTFQVVDSVLYDGSTDKTVSGPSITSPGNGSNTAANITTVSWTGGTSKYTLWIKNPGGSFAKVPGCQNTTLTSCPAATTSSGNYQIYVIDADTNRSSTVSFSR